MTEKIDLEINQHADTTVVIFKTAAISDVEMINAVSSRIKGYIKEKQPQKIIFDFGDVKFFSSKLLGLLLDIRARLRSYDGRVILSSINPQLYRVFKITNLDRIFSFFPDKQSAIESDAAG